MCARLCDARGSYDEQANDKRVTHVVNLLLKLIVYFRGNVNTFDLLVGLGYDFRDPAFGNPATHQIVHEVCVVMCGYGYLDVREMIAEKEYHFMVGEFGEFVVPRNNAECRLMPSVAHLPRLREIVVKAVGEGRAAWWMANDQMSVKKPMGLDVFAFGNVAAAARMTVDRMDGGLGSSFGWTDRTAAEEATDSVNPAVLTCPWLPGFETYELRAVDDVRRLPHPVTAPECKAMT